ncbi:hypothetical protein Angca_009043, partial [Angiostrongylus cantonensis]
SPQSLMTIACSTNITEFRGAVTVEPAIVKFTPAGGKLTVTLKNGGERVVFKVKCSNNNEYGIQPIYGFIAMSSTISLMITRLPGKPKEDIMVIQWVQTKDDGKDAKDAFTAAPRGSIQSITVPLIVST